MYVLLSSDNTTGMSQLYVAECNHVQQ